MQRRLHVLEILDVQRLIETELDVVRADHLLDALLHRAALLHGAHQPLANRIPWCKSRDQEVQRGRAPQDDAELHQAPQNVSEMHASE